MTIEPPRRPQRGRAAGWRTALVVGAAVYLLGYGALRTTGWFYLTPSCGTGRCHVTSTYAFRFVRAVPPLPRPTRLQSYVHEHVGHLYGPLRDIEAVLRN